jgi:hypothetical protein
MIAQEESLRCLLDRFQQDATITYSGSPLDRGSRPSTSTSKYDTC